MTYIKASPVTAEVSRVRPQAVPSHLIIGIEPVTLNEARCQTKSHGCVISPLTSLETEWTSANHIIQWLETSSWTTFDGSTDGIAHSKTKKATAETLYLVHIIASNHNAQIKS
jgi:hypothetical protein